MPRILSLLVLFCLTTTAVAAEWTPLADLRVRQEILDGVYHFASEPDRNWIRVRPRAGVRLDLAAHRLELRLANEHRHYITPDTDFRWDELLIDRGFWRWQVGESRQLTVGRQDIIWRGGFLLLDGGPLDGSRSIYHDAVRWQAGALDLAAIWNHKYDPLLLASDLEQDRPRTDMDELGLAARWAGDRWTWSLIAEHQDDPDDALPDLTTLTGSARVDGPVGDGGHWHVDLAVQYQDGRVASAYTDLDPDASGWALAAEGDATTVLGSGWTLEAGGFYYSGQESSLRPFRTPWGRWPKWSELYIYTLIGESTAGRVHVAAWENIAAPRIMFRYPISERVKLRVGAQYLLAPATSWEARGVMTQAELKADLGRGFTSHLLLETLAPGKYHDGSHDLPALTDTVYFLRWQVMWSL